MKNRVIKDIIILPLLTLFILMFLTLKNIISIPNNYFLIVFCIVLGVGLRITESYLNYRLENNKKDVKLIRITFIFVLSFILFIVFNMQTIKLIILSIGEHSFGYLRTIPPMAVLKSFASFVFYDLLFILSYASLKYVFIDKKINLLLISSLIISFADIVIHQNVSIIHVITISIIILIILLNHFYYNLYAC